MPKIDWYGVLKAVRRLKGPITSENLGSEAGLGVPVASAWLSKFYKWGYVKPIRIAKGKKRWVREYELTRWGKRYKSSK